LRTQREALERINRQIGERVSLMGEERESLRHKHDRQSREIENTSQRLQQLKHEVENVKGLITTLSGDRPPE
jgi:hypothetical protein